MAMKSETVGQRIRDIRTRQEAVDNILLRDYKSGKLDKEMFELAMHDNYLTALNAIKPLRALLEEIEFSASHA